MRNPMERFAPQEAGEYVDPASCAPEPELSLAQIRQRLGAARCATCQKPIFVVSETTERPADSDAYCQCPIVVHRYQRAAGVDVEFWHDRARGEVVLVVDGVVLDDNRAPVPSTAAARAIGEAFEAQDRRASIDAAANDNPGLYGSTAERAPTDDEWADLEQGDAPMTPDAAWDAYAYREDDRDG